MSSSYGESGRKGRVFLEQRVVLEAVVELAEHAVEEALSRCWVCECLMGRRGVVGLRFGPG
ncbi:hypothetical protein, partial [Streptomyces sp. ADI95-17]|uniref:hypothetical protein n=1 Tax=Streptomyces sp. ADI95-17 TaxID=1522759 RepID=UPI0019CFAE8F